VGARLCREGERRHRAAPTADRDVPHGLPPETDTAPVADTDTAEPADTGCELLTRWRDHDRDGWGGEELLACADTPGLADEPGDCDDTRAHVHPFAPDRCSNGVDEDCDGSDAPCSTFGSYEGFRVDVGLAVVTVARAADLDGDGSTDLITGSP
jgi:hypothetical protein